MQPKTDLGIQLPGGKTGVLLLHDVGASAAELRAQANAFARAGYTVSCPQFIGLGSSSVPGQGSAGMLVSEAEQALSKLKGRCDNVVVVGHGYGGMLALELARHNAIAVQAAVMVEPRAWLPSLPFELPAAWSGRVKQAWLAGILALPNRVLAMFRGAPLAGVSAVSRVAAGPGATPAGIHNIARLLDSVHAALPSIRQPVLIVQRPGSVRGGRDGSFLLQRRLGGRVESSMLEELQPNSSRHDLGAEALGERCIRFFATVLTELETRRDNELRRQRVATAGRSTDAA